MKSLAVFLSIATVMQASAAWTGELDGQVHVPDGFVVEQVAGESQVVFPMFACFDDRGRLYVAESSGLDLYEGLQTQTRNCRIRRLEDRDGDGRFESSQIFADQLVFPMGLCWHDDKLYVADPPNLVAFEDRDGDGRAEERNVILTGFGHADNGSLHGLVFGPDGFLYMTMGRPDGYRLEDQNGTTLAGKSGALIRCRPDGTNPEVVCRGFVNLVELVFTPQGEMIGTDNFFQMPAGGLRDAIVDLAPGGLYPLSLQDEGTPQPMTGEPLPAISLFPAVAPSGLVRYEGIEQNDAFHGHLFSAQHNSRKVQRHKLSRVGSTFASEDIDFVTSESADFHPSDVLQDADGSLLVIDTGGWYVQHCPTGRIRDSHAPGGIYRIRRQDARNDKPNRAQAWGLELDWKSASPEKLCGLLSDPRPRVRHRAGMLLRRHGAQAVGPLGSTLQQTENIQTKQLAIWALAGCTDPSSLEPLQQALESDQNEVVMTAARALGMRGEESCSPRLCELLSRGEPPVGRAAADALARCGQPEAVPALFGALTNEPDRFLKHALIHAIYRLASEQQLLSALADPDPAVQQCALLLLDQPPHRSVTNEAVIARLGATDEKLRHAAIGILMRHPEWADDAQALLQKWLHAPSLSEMQRAAVPSLIVAFQDQSDMQRLVGTMLRERELPSNQLVLLLRSLGQCSLGNLPRSWIDGLSEATRHSDADVQRAAVQTAAKLQLAELDPALTDFSKRSDVPMALQVAALGAVAGREQGLADPAFQLLCGQIDKQSDQQSGEQPEQPKPLARLAAAEVLGRVRLTDAQLMTLLQQMPVDPLIWPQLLPAYRRSHSLEVGLRLVALLEKLVNSDSFRPSEAEVHQLLESYPEKVRQKERGLLTTLRQRTAALGERLKDYQSLGAGGDVDCGRKIFFGAEVACAACHRVASQGGNVGPDLTTIGAVRSTRDLIESIVAPSSTFAQGYENYMVVTIDGQIASGRIVRQSGRTVVLQGAGGQEQRFHEADIEEMTRQPVSIMPDGLDQKLSRAQLRDLLAYLKSLK